MINTNVHAIAPLGAVWRNRMYAKALTRQRSGSNERSMRQGLSRGAQDNGSLQPRLLGDRD
jgi:hypothetical protein